MLPGSVGDRAENILGTVLKNQRFNYKLPARIPQTMLGPGKASRPRGSLCSFGSSVGLESPTIHCKTGSLYPEPIPNSLYTLRVDGESSPVGDEQLPFEVSGEWLWVASS